ncbi:hypothetical protein BH09DEP1_BH09DEP1_1370 [soil metagenome]
MKYMYAALLAMGLLSTGLVQAKVEEVKKTHIIRKKPSVYKKTSKPAAKPAKVQSHRKKAQPKRSVYKNVTKRAVNPTPAPIAATKSTPTTTPVAAPQVPESNYQKLGSWLGLGTGAAASTAVAKSAVAGHHRAAGYHTGPRKEKWNHKFESYWGNKGFSEGVNSYGHWVFGSYRPDWWQKNYPVYWKDVVGPLYRHSAEYQKTLGK